MSGVPRYPYGEMLIFGVFASIIGHYAIGWPGAVVAALLVVVMSVAATEYGWRPDHG